MSTVLYLGATVMLLAMCLREKIISVIFIMIFIMIGWDRSANRGSVIGTMVQQHGGGSVDSTGVQLDRQSIILETSLGSADVGRRQLQGASVIGSPSVSLAVPQDISGRVLHSVSKHILRITQARVKRSRSVEAAVQRVPFPTTLGRYHMSRHTTTVRHDRFQIIAIERSQMPGVTLRSSVDAGAGVQLDRASVIDPSSVPSALPRDIRGRVSSSVSNHVLRMRQARVKKGQRAALGIFA